MRPTSCVIPLWLLVFAACGDRAEQPKTSSPFEEATASVIARGDTMLAAGDTANARAIWSMLIGFDSTNVEAKERLDVVGPRAISPSLDEVRWVDQLMKRMNYDHWCGFPARNPESDLLNLKMLGDAQLLPTLRTVGLRAPSGICDDKDAFLPLAAPALTIAELRERYGTPTAEEKDADGSVALTYGRFRMFGDKQGNIIAIVIPSFVDAPLPQRLELRRPLAPANRS